MPDINDLARKIQDNFDVVYELYQEAEADGDLLAEELSRTIVRLIEVLEENKRLETEVARLRWLMSMRVDGDHTLLETYEMHDPEFIDRMRGKNA